MQISRRGFIGGAFAACGGMAAWADGLCGRPLLKFGVLSDVHIGGKPDAVERLEKSLRWVKAQGVDAVLFPGDIAHSGLIRELERFAETWYKVFPGGKGADGGKVELMIATGNHDRAASWVKGTDEWRTRNVFTHGDNERKVWDRLFHEEWQLIWKKTVKGFVFTGGQWPTPASTPPLEEWFRQHAAELKGGRPFFYSQHAHPKGTCHGNILGDNGAAVRALSAFPNAVSFTGHSHYTLADERAVWQGAFTSIGAGCLHEGGTDFTYDNVSAFWHESFKKRLMKCVDDEAERPWGGDPKGGGFELVEVFADHLVVHRRSTEFDLPIGPDWIVPLPARADGPFDFARQKARRSAPQFAAGASISAKVCPSGHPMEGAGRKGEPCVYVTFPCAKPVDGCRVFDYLVTASCGGKTVAKAKLQASGCTRPLEVSDSPGECLFSLKDMPKGQDVVVSAVPRDCFGLTGRAISSSPLRMPS